MLSGLQTVEHGLILFLVGFGLAYFFGGVVLGYRFWGAAARAGAVAADPIHDYAVFFLVPALDEAEVIAETVSRLAANPGATVVLIDDGSSDETAELARWAGGDNCLVLSRRLPEARLGKGAALNAGFALVREEVARRCLDPAHTLICVMDADGHLSAGAVQRVEVLFDDPQVGGVQLPVRIRNRRKLIERLQDLEFWALSALSQFARVAFGNVSLGGNGQFTRLSVLLSLDAAPWSQSLTEDLDLAVRITLQGNRLVSTPLVWVDQQALTSWSRLLRQRTRWMQGHMTCGRYVWKLLRSPNVSNPAAIETVLYLSVPWVLVLPWSILFHLTWTQTIISIVRYGLPIHASGVVPVTLYCLYLYLVSFLPMIVAGLIYRRRDGSIGLVRSVLMGHLLIAGFYVAMIAAWRAVFRMLRGRVGWDKTARVIEAPVVAPALAVVELGHVPGVVRQPVLVGAGYLSAAEPDNLDGVDMTQIKSSDTRSADPAESLGTGGAGPGPNGSGAQAGKHHRSAWRARRSVARADRTIAEDLPDPGPAEADGVDRPEQTSSREPTEAVDALERLQLELRAEIDRREFLELQLEAAEQRADDALAQADQLVADSQRRADERIAWVEQVTDQFVAGVERVAQQRVIEADQIATRRIAEARQRADERAEQRVAAVDAQAEQRVREGRRSGEQRVADAHRVVERRMVEAQEAADRRVAEADQRVVTVEQRVAELAAEKVAALEAERAAGAERERRVELDLAAEAERRRAAEQRAVCAERRSAEIEQRLTDLQSEIAEERAQAGRHVERLDQERRQESKVRERAEPALTAAGVAAAVT